MDLLEMVNGYAVPSVHALLIEPFKSIWNNDTSSNNIESTKIFTYIELLCSPKKSNPFAGYEEEIRVIKVKEEVWGDGNYPITHQIMLATLRYKELLSDSSMSYGLYVDAVTGVEKLRKFLREFSLDERTPGGAMVLKPRDITSAMKDIDDVAKNMESSRDRVHTELIQTSKTRNQRDIGDYER